jgi:hypothetical protein
MLFDFANSFSDIYGQEYKIKYKVHPNEDIGSYSESHINLEVVGSEVDVHTLLTESSIQIGVYSAALYEGLALGCRTYIVDLPGCEHMDDVIKRGYADLVREPSDINFGKSMKQSPNGYFIASDWRENLDKIMREIDLVE